jgi:hypothetical protein
MRTIILSLLLLSCGQLDVKKPAVNSPELQEQIERMTPLLLWCEGAPAFPRKNNITGQPNCDVGDSVSTGGAVYSLGGIGDVAAIERAMEPNGRLWRHASYVRRDTSNSLSRDAEIGFYEAMEASKNFTLLRRHLRYTKSIGKLCPDATDNRCDITPGVAILARYVLGESVSMIERSQDASTILVEAHTAPPTYRAYLIARKLRLVYITGNADKYYEQAAKVLYSRFPKSMYIRVVHSLYTNGGFNGVVKDLTKCMKEWKKPGMDWFGNAIDNVCTGNHQGSDLQSLAIFLTGIKGV